VVDADGGDDGQLSYVEIDYAPNSQDPARVFRAMASLIDSFHQIDRDLAKSVHVSIAPAILLERIEAGSVRAWLRTILQQADDDALKNLDWKPLVGQYLVRGKHLILRWLDGKSTIDGRSQLSELQRHLLAIAPAPVAGDLALPEPVPPRALMDDLQRLGDAFKQLGPGDAAKFVSGDESTDAPLQFRLEDARIEEILTEAVTESTSELVLLVKRPDYLGNSRWEFRLGDQAIEAKITDSAWLTRFQSGLVPLKPGDALVARVRSEVSQGFEGNIVSTRHIVVEVLSVRHIGDEPQLELSSSE
jgi:hypothetical protein